MVIITGVGRCGTSLVAEYLQKIGFKTDAKNYYKEVNAGHESVKSVEISSFYIKNKLQNKPNKHLHEIFAIGGIGLDFIKDPLFLVYPELIIEWHKRIPVKVLMMRRDPVSITLSCMRSPTMSGPNYRNYPEQIIEHENEFIKICQDNNIKLHQIQFPDVVDNPKPLFEALNINRHIDKGFWKLIADKNKVHV